MHNHHVRRGALSVIGFGIGTMLITMVLSTSADASSPAGATLAPTPVATPAVVEPAPSPGAASIGQTPVARPALVPVAVGDQWSSGPAASPTGPVAEVEDAPVAPPAPEPAPSDPPVVHAGPGPVTPAEGVTTLIDPVTIERSAYDDGA